LQSNVHKQYTKVFDSCIQIILWLSAHRDNYVSLMWPTEGRRGGSTFDSVGHPRRTSLQSRDRRRRADSTRVVLTAAIGNYRLAIRTKVLCRRDDLGRGRDRMFRPMPLAVT